MKGKMLSLRSLLAVEVSSMIESGPPSATEMMWERSPGRVMVSPGLTLMEPLAGMWCQMPSTLHGHVLGRKGGVALGPGQLKTHRGTGNDGDLFARLLAVEVMGFGLAGLHKQVFAREGGDRIVVGSDVLRLGQGRSKLVHERRAEGKQDQPAVLEVADTKIDHLPAELLIADAFGVGVELQWMPVGPLGKSNTIFAGIANGAFNCRIDF